MNKQQLASKIWESANKMRSKIEANEYKDYILGFIFYKFLSEKETETLLKDGWSKEDFKEYLTEDDEETVKYCQKNLGYFISYNNLFFHRTTLFFFAYNVNGNWQQLSIFMKIF